MCCVRLQLGLYGGHKEAGLMKELQQLCFSFFHPVPGKGLLALIARYLKKARIRKVIRSFDKLKDSKIKSRLEHKLNSETGRFRRDLNMNVLDPGFFEIGYGRVNLFLGIRRTRRLHDQ